MHRNNYKVLDRKLITEIAFSRGWTLSKLAAHANLSPGCIFKVGEIPQHPGTIFKIAEALGVEPDSIIRKDNVNV